MKSVAVALVMLLASFAAFGDNSMASGKDGMGDDYLSAEIQKLVKANSDMKVSDLTFGDIDQMMRDLSVPIQETAYVEKSAAASWMMPGKGQFMNDDALSGVLFLTADIAVAAGTLVGSYFLLPEELRFSNLDYLNTSFADIKATWKNAAESATVSSSLPLWAVMAGGMTLHHFIAVFSAKHAASLARDRIDKGLVTFEPMPVIDRRSHFGFGAMMKY